MARLEVSGGMVRREGRLVLSIPHLELMADEVLVIIGPNGAGKSTLLQTLGLLLPLSEGTISVDGLPVRRSAAALAARRRLAMVFQEPLLFDTSVASNVASGLALRGVPRAEQRRRVEIWLAAFGIDHLAQRPARTLSGGEAQRVSLARALALDPDILLLDEPFAALDPTTRAALTDDMERLIRRSGRAVAIVTHDRTEALRLGDRVAVMVDGQIAQIDRPATVFGYPASSAVAAFVGVETILPGEILAAEAGLLTVAVGRHHLMTPGELAVGHRVLVCLRPEDVALTLAPAGDHREPPTSVRNHLPGVVARLVPAGALVRVEVECDGHRLIALVTRPSAEALTLAPGQPVIASVKASAVHLIQHDQTTPH